MLLLYIKNLGTCISLIFVDGQVTVQNINTVKILLWIICVGHIFVKMSCHRIGLINQWIYLENCKVLLCVCISVIFIYIYIYIPAAERLEKVKCVKRKPSHLGFYKVVGICMYVLYVLLMGTCECLWVLIDFSCCLAGVIRFQS